MKKSIVAGMALGFMFGLMVTAVQANPLVNGLGGTAGFGENFLAANDDGSTGAIDISTVFSGGLNFFGTTYSSLYVNNNGNVTLNSAMSTYTPFSLVGDTGNPLFAPFFADVDTGNGAQPATPGGTSTGSNLAWYDLDTTNGVFTATWDDVGFYDENVSSLNAFQLQLTDRSADFSNGDFDITFVYEDIGWTLGEASDEDHARAGWNSGNGTDFEEMGQSGNVPALTSLDTNPGMITWEVRNGAVVPLPDPLPDPGGSSPVPEPATMLLFGTGLVGLMGSRLRRRKK